MPRTTVFWTWTLIALVGLGVGTNRCRGEGGGVRKEGTGLAGHVQQGFGARVHALWQHMLGASGRVAETDSAVHSNRRESVRPRLLESKQAQTCGAYSARVHSQVRQRISNVASALDAAGIARSDAVRPAFATHALVACRDTMRPFNQTIIDLAIHSPFLSARPAAIAKLVATVTATPHWEKTSKITVDVRDVRSSRKESAKRSLYSVTFPGREYTLRLWPAKRLGTRERDRWTLGIGVPKEWRDRCGASSGDYRRVGREWMPVDLATRQQFPRWMAGRRAFRAQQQPWRYRPRRTYFHTWQSALDQSLNDCVK